jgi:hypothetical protein
VQILAQIRPSRVTPAQPVIIVAEVDDNFALAIAVGVLTQRTTTVRAA